MVHNLSVSSKNEYLMSVRECANKSFDLQSELTHACMICWNYLWNVNASICFFLQSNPNKIVQVHVNTFEFIRIDDWMEIEMTRRQRADCWFVDGFGHIQYGQKQAKSDNTCARVCLFRRPIGLPNTESHPICYWVRVKCHAYHKHSNFDSPSICLYNSQFLFCFLCLFLCKKKKKKKCKKRKYSNWNANGHDQSVHTHTHTQAHAYNKNTLTHFLHLTSLHKCALLYFSRSLFFSFNIFHSIIWLKWKKTHGFAH